MGAAPYNPHHQSLTRHIEITNNLILVSYCYCDIRPHSLVSLYRFYLNIKGVIYVISVHPGVLKHFICLFHCVLNFRDSAHLGLDFTDVNPAQISEQVKVLLQTNKKILSVKRKPLWLLQLNIKM